MNQTSWTYSLAPANYLEQLNSMISKTAVHCQSAKIIAAAAVEQENPRKPDQKNRQSILLALVNYHLM